ncbi:phosphopantetheine-binding protein [Streptomyces sp. NPDC002785]|uniref:phosphopantetheine-binding protein n=1 Tax=Streptomyces sp. NPDC002785 TaxID=3154543 RepID=UPI00331BCCBD
MTVPDDAKTATSTAEVARLWGTLLHLPKVPEDVSLLALGGDSSLLMEIEERFGVHLGADDVLDDLTVRGFAVAIDRAGSAATDQR